MRLLRFESILPESSLIQKHHTVMVHYGIRKNERASEFQGFFVVISLLQRNYRE